MMVNNFATVFDYISNTIDKKLSKYYIVVTVRQRRKDKGNENMTRGEHTIKTFYISSASELMNMSGEMMKLADDFNARIYINLNPKPMKAVAFNMQKRYAEMVFDESYKNPTSIAESIVFNTDTPRSFQTLMFDVDTNENISLEEVKRDLLHVFDDKRWVSYLRVDTKIEPIIMPSKSGLHIVTKPFNRNVFNERIASLNKYKFAEEARPSDIEYYDKESNHEVFGIKENANILLYFNEK